MRTVAHSLMIIAMLAPPVVAGAPLCYTPARQSYGYGVKNVQNYAQSYAQPVYHQKYVAPVEQKLTVIIKPVLYPTAQQGYDQYQYSLQDQISPYDVGATIEGLKAVAEIQASGVTALSSTIETVDANKHAADTRARQFIAEREEAKHDYLAYKAYLAARLMKQGNQQEHVPPAPEPQDGVLSIEAIDQDAILNQSCVKCHNAASDKTGLDLTKGWANLAPEERDAIGERTTTDDPKLRMPPPPAKQLPYAYRKMLTRE